MRAWNSYGDCDMGKLFLLFAALPLVDLFVLFRIGRAFGGGVSILLVLVSGVCGALLLRAASARVMGAWRASLARGTPPDDTVFSGVLSMFGCGLLITPGPISDVLGLALLIPAVRRKVAQHVGQRVFEAISRGAMRVNVQGPFVRGPEPRREVIDVEAEVVDPERPALEDKSRQLKG